MRPSWLVLIGFPVVACTAAKPPSPPAAPPPAPANPYSTCWVSSAPPDCARTVEAELIAQAGGRVARRADTLFIRTSSEYPVRLVNRPGEGDRYLAYLYFGELVSLPAHLVRVDFYEGGTFVLVDRASGNETHVYSPPVVSPGGERFAAAMLDLEAGYEPNGVQIWRVSASGPRLEWTINGGETWGANELDWRSDRVLDFTKHTVVPGEPEPVQTRMRLRLGENALVLEALE